MGWQLLAADLLIGHGADVNALDNKTRTPLTLAIQGKDKEIAALLKEAGGKE